MYRLVKRIIDLLIAVLGLIVAFPLIFIGVVISYLSTGSPFFFQARIGEKSRSFVIVKLRTYRLDGGSSPLLRVLRNSKIDELPQLINIIKGDMSFVGPRPLLPEYWNVLELHYPDRSRVKPGLTGISQIKGGNRLPWSTRLELDVEYARSSSLLKDFMIVMATPFSIFKNWGNSESDSLLNAFSKVDNPRNDK